MSQGLTKTRILELFFDFSDNTIADTSTSYHGLAPKLSGDVNTYLDGAGSYTNVAEARGLRETSGPTSLSVGNILDGQILKRVGSAVIGTFLLTAFILSTPYEEVYILNQISTVPMMVLSTGTLGGP